MRNFAISVATIALLVSSNGDAKLNLAADSRLSPTDKTLWLVPDMVSVGTVLRTDPASWSPSGIAPFTVYTGYLEGKLPVGPGPQGTETLSFSSAFDLGAVLPFLKLFSANFKRSKSVTLTAQNSTIDQIPYAGTALYALQAADRASKNESDGSAFVRLRAGAAAAGERPELATFWIVTKVYRAGTLTWTDNRNHSFALGGGCPVIVQANLPGPSAEAAQPAAATPIASSTTKTAKSIPKILTSGNGSLSPGDRMPLAASLTAKVDLGASSQTSAAGETTAPSKAVAATGCPLARLSTGSARDGSGSATNAIVFVQIKPIFMNSRTKTLYFPDHTFAPKVISAS